MGEQINYGWLEDANNIKFAPKTISTEIYTENGEKYALNIQNQINKKPGRIVTGETVKYNGQNYIAGDGAEIFNKGTAIKGGSHAEGNSIAVGTYSHAEGLWSESLEAWSHAEGFGTIAAELASHAEGQQSYAIGPRAHAEGHSTIAAGISAHSEGEGKTTELVKISGLANTTTYYLTYSIPAVYNYITLLDPDINNTFANIKTAKIISISDDGHTIETDQSLASYDLSNIQGVVYSTGAIGDQSHSEGYQTIAVGNFSHAEGLETQANGAGSHAGGNSTIANGHYSHTEGFMSCADGVYSHAEGMATANSAYSHAEGVATTYGMLSHAEGSSNSIGECSHAEGFGTTLKNIQISGNANSLQYTIINPPALFKIDLPSYIVLISNNTLQGGVYAEILSFDSNTNTITVDKTLSATKALDSANTIITTSGAFGKYSHSEGYETIALNNDETKPQHVEGAYNIPDTENKYAYIVGNGKNTLQRSNAYTLDWEGNATFSGKVKANNFEGLPLTVEYNTFDLPCIKNPTAMACSPDDSIAVIIGDGRPAVYSTDGINWEYTLLPIKKKWTNIKWVNNQFLIWNNEGSNIIIYGGSDGIHWNYSALPSLNGTYIIDIAGDNNNTLIATLGYPESYDMFYYISIDNGLTWKTLEMNEFAETFLRKLKPVVGDNLIIAISNDEGLGFKQYKNGIWIPYEDYDHINNKNFFDNNTIDTFIYLKILNNNLYIQNSTTADIYDVKDLLTPSIGETSIQNFFFKNNTFYTYSHISHTISSYIPEDSSSYTSQELYIYGQFIPYKNYFYDVCDDYYNFKVYNINDLTIVNNINLLAINESKIKNIGQKILVPCYNYGQQKSSIYYFEGIYNKLFNTFKWTQYENPDLIPAANFIINPTKDIYIPYYTNYSGIYNDNYIYFYINSNWISYPNSETYLGGGQTYSYYYINNYLIQVARRYDTNPSDYTGIPTTYYNNIIKFYDESGTLISTINTNFNNNINNIIYNNNKYYVFTDSSSYYYVIDDPNATTFTAQTILLNCSKPYYIDSSTTILSNEDINAYSDIIYLLKNNVLTQYTLPVKMNNLRFIKCNNIIIIIGNVNNNGSQNITIVYFNYQESSPSFYGTEKIINLRISLLDNIFYNIDSQQLIFCDLSKYTSPFNIQYGETPIFITENYKIKFNNIDITNKLF